MKIKEIRIKNFGSYYGDNNVLNFDSGLTLCLGDNGDGKTTLFEAIDWLFNTSTTNIPEAIISGKRFAELSENETDTVSVSMSFEHEGEKTIEKSFVFTKTNNNLLKINNFNFYGFEINGTERNKVKGDALLEKCFDASIRKYCLFKGEKDLDVFGHSNALKELIDAFSEIKDFAPYYSEDEGNGFTNYAEEQSRKLYENTMRADRKNEQKERELRTALEKLRIDISNTKQRLKNSRDESYKYSNLLDEIESNEEASMLLKDINDRLKSLSEKQSTVNSCIDDNYTTKLLDEMWILCGFSDIFEEFQKKVDDFRKGKIELENAQTKQKGKQELANEIAEGIIPLSPHIPDRISMQDMIKDEWCKVCGRKAKKGSDAYKFMVNKLNELLKSQQPKEKTEEKPLFTNNFSHELEQKSIGLSYNQESDINSKSQAIRDKIKLNADRKTELDNLQKSIDDEKGNRIKLLAQCNLPEEQLNNINVNYRNWTKSKSDADGQIPLLEQEEIRINNAIIDKQKEYDDLAKSSVASIYSKIHTVLNKIQNAFKYAKEKNTKNFLEILEVKANEYLNKLNIGDFTGVIRILKTPDGSARIALILNDGSILRRPNKAQEITVYMSVLFAISELTKKKRESDYPLIFDAPTSDFGPKKDNAFYNLISKIDKQCVVITKSFINDDGTLMNDIIDDFNCSKYRLKMQSGFKIGDLSTVQTTIKPID